MSFFSFIKKFLKNPWTIAIGSAIVVYIIVKIIDQFTGSKIFISIYEALKFFYKINVIRIELPIWLIILISIFLIFILIFLFVLLFKRKINEPKFKKLYNKEFIDNIFWLWEWDYREFRIYNLNPLCPKCLIELKPLFRHIGRKVYGSCNCSICELDFKLDNNKFVLVNDLIISRVRTGEWEKRIKIIEKERIEFINSIKK